jgi:hypothetical protein
VKITCNRCGSTLENAGGVADTTGRIGSLFVKPCHVCMGDAAQRGFEHGQKVEREHLDAISDE